MWDCRRSSSVITENEFDELKRVTSKEFAIGHNVADDSERKAYTRTFTYNKTHLTRQDDTFLGNNVGAHSYNYDSTGRIWSDNYTSLYAPTDYRTYKYDDYGQLVRENNQGLDKTYVYEYNDIGNLTSVKAYDYTLSEELTGTPVTISPDDTAYLSPESVNGLNLYSYCGNDPINIVDTVSGKSVVANQNGTYPHTSASKLVGSANQFNLPKLPWLISNATTLYGTYSAISAGIPIFAHYFRYAKTIGDEFRLYGISKWRTSLQLADVNLKMTKLDGFLLGINVGLDIYDSIQRGVSLGGVALGAGLTAASGVGMLYLNKGIMWACTTVGTAISPGLGTAIGFVVGLAVSIVVDIWLGNALSEWIDQIAT